jgi:hypothetical protein
MCDFARNTLSKVDAVSLRKEKKNRERENNTKKKKKKKNNNNNLLLLVRDPQHAVLGRLFVPHQSWRERDVLNKARVNVECYI